jgi:uroporphyrin-III C-methyltransferase/precorrin-2 dehydrogenase/sirohydrochlorin ferrochelatase
VGAGPVALRRVTSLLDVGADVVVVAPASLDAITDLAQRGRLRLQLKQFEPADLDDAWLAMALTNDPAANEQVVTEAERRRLFCLRADDATAASAWMPAVGRTGPAVVAVHAGRDPRRATRLRDVAVAAVETALRSGVAPATRPGPSARPRSTSGRVVLVGGGPGDPGLLTRRGWQRLGEADVVVVDRLAPLAALGGLRDDVVVVDVSKAPRGAFTPQERINAVLVEHARAGRVVVRLKGGDPFVFGRGMEEVEACVAAGIAVEVVPGVTSAVAVPELVGVPVTHRGLSQGFCVVSGHVPPGDARGSVDWAALARSGLTLVCLMAVDNLPLIAAELLSGGMAGDMPVICIQDGGMPGQRVVRTSVGRAVTDGSGVQPPAVIVIGAVAALGSPS